MAEYIRKQTVLNLIDDIEFDAENWVYTHDGKIQLKDGAFSKLHEAVKAIPPVDVVEVVRCKDCEVAEFYESSEGRSVYECNFWNGEHYGEHAKVDGNDYCSYGSRR